MKWLYKLDYKYGRHAIQNLMLVIVFGQGMVYLANMFAPSAMIMSRLSLNWAAVMHGEVWRLVTFIFVQSSSSIFFLLITLYFYYFIGSTLERSWGAFKFNIYYLIGIVGAIIAAAIAGYGTTYYLNMSLFFAFAVLFPDMQVLLFFILPIKMKYLAYFSAALTAFDFIRGSFSTRMAIVMALANFLLFFGGPFIKQIKQNAKYAKTRREWQNNNNNNNSRW